MQALKQLYYKFRANSIYLLYMLLIFKSKKTYRYIGLKRSGNHAIINWHIKQCKETVFLFNNLKITKGLKGAAQKQLYHFNLKHLLYKPLVVIITYEDRTIDDTLHNEQLLCLPANSKIFNVFILRDYKNMLASRFKKWPGATMEILPLLFPLYKSYLEAIEDPDMLKGKTVTANYNQWLLSNDYRQKLSQHLDVQFTDAGRDEVTFYGGGSSFTGQKEIPAEADLLNRWKNVKNIDELCVAFDADDDFQRLYLQHFGE